MEEPSLDEEPNQPAAMPLWLRGHSHFPFRESRRFHRLLSSAEIAGVAQMALLARPIQYKVLGLPTPNRATAGRRPLTPRTTTQVRPFRQLLDKRTGALSASPPYCF